MLAHLFFEHLLKDRLHALPDPSLHVALHLMVELLVRGQVCLLTQPTTYQTLSHIPSLVITEDGDTLLDTRPALVASGTREVIQPGQTYGYGMLDKLNQPISRKKDEITLLGLELALLDRNFKLTAYSTYKKPGGW